MLNATDAAGAEAMLKWMENSDVQNVSITDADLPRSPTSGARSPLQQPLSDAKAERTAERLEIADRVVDLQAEMRALKRELSAERRVLSHTFLHLHTLHVVASWASRRSDSH